MTLAISSRTRRVLRAEMFERQSGRCHWCAGRMSIEREDAEAPNYATFEHLKPKAMGGTDDRANLVLSHRSCNDARGKRMVVAMRGGAPAASEARP